MYMVSGVTWRDSCVHGIWCHMEGQLCTWYLVSHGGTVVYMVSGVTWKGQLCTWYLVSHGGTVVGRDLSTCVQLIPSAAAGKHNYCTVKPC